jgi:predicted transcriptional regulator
MDDDKINRSQRYVGLSDEVVARIDAYAKATRRTRANAMAWLVEVGLGTEAARMAADFTSGGSTR